MDANTTVTPRVAAHICAAYPSKRGAAADGAADVVLEGALCERFVIVICGGCVDVAVGTLVSEGGSVVMVTFPVSTGTGMKETDPDWVSCVAWPASLTVSVHTANPLSSPHCTFTEKDMVSSEITAISEICEASSTSVIVNGRASVVIPVTVTLSIPDSTYVVPSVPVPCTSPSNPKSWKATGNNEAVDVCALATAAMHTRTCQIDSTRDADITMFDVIACYSQSTISTTISHFSLGTRP